MDTLKGVATDLGDFISPYLKKAVQVITEVVDFYRNLFKNWGAIMDNAKLWLGEKWDALGRNILYHLQIAGIDILKWADGIGNSIANSISEGISWVSGGLVDLGQSTENPIYEAQKKALTDVHKAQLDYDKSISNRRVDIYSSLAGVDKFDGTKKEANPPTGKDRKYNLNGPTADKDSAKEKAKNLDKLGDRVNGITGGGTRNTYITLGKFQDAVNIYVNNTKDGIDRLQEHVEDAMLRVLNSAGQ
jgi:hypothetical protein